MYEDKGGGQASSAGGWQVSPEQVRDFAAAVEQVRADLTKIHSEVDNMSTPNYAALLGTSPVGQELAEKFSDRMGSETGLRGQLKLALDRMDEFVASAEKTATGYQQHDEDSAGNLRYSG
jgi:hypothetical protein